MKRIILYIHLSQIKANNLVESLISFRYAIRPTCNDKPLLPGGSHHHHAVWCARPCPTATTLG